MNTVTNDTIIYEQPLNERTRTLLRLEDLFTQIDHTLLGTTTWDNKATIQLMLELISIFDRGDVKGEVIKELERHTISLTRLQETPGVDRVKLQSLLDKLHLHIDTLQKIVGKFGQHLKEVDLIYAVRQRLGIPGGTCSFDMPMYHYWLQQPLKERQKQLESWLSSFSPLKNATYLLTKLTRESTTPIIVTANNGFYQKPLEPSNPCQLVRVTVPRSLQAYPEISGSKHRISIRLMKQNGSHRPSQLEQNLDFELSCCVI